MRAEIDEMFMPIHYCNMKTILLHTATLVKSSLAKYTGYMVYSCYSVICVYTQLYLVQGLPAVKGHTE